MPVARFRGPAHPDALCDAMAAALVEAYLVRDPEARTHISVSAGRESVFVDGDLVSKADFDGAPILKQVMAEVDPMLALEPFITCEAVQPDVLPVAASADHCIVSGYATAETSDGLPPARSAGRSYVRALECFRLQEEDGFLLAPDYDALFDDARREAVLRVAGVAAEQGSVLDRHLARLLVETLPNWTLRVVGLGTEGGGLRRRSGISGRWSSVDAGSSHLPFSGSGVGFVVRHPANMGQWLAQAEARRLVREGKGRGVLVVLRWEAFDTRPQLVSARNERGEDLAGLVDVAMLDLTAPHETYSDPKLLLRAQRIEWDAAITLPWEV